MRVLREIKIDELSAVDAPAQEGAKALLMKRRPVEDLAKVAFQEALTELKLEESVYEACRELWTLDEALRRSVEEIVEDPQKYPNPNQALKESLASFANAVSTMVANVIQDVGKRADPDDLDKARLSPAVQKCMVEKANEWKRQNPGKTLPQEVIKANLVECQRVVTLDKADKTEGGESFPASDYAYVPDPEKPSTWKLRLTSTPGGTPDPRIVGAAVAALGPGFRGQKVEIPEADLAAVHRKVRSAWIKANPDKSEDDLPDVLKACGPGKDKDKMSKTVEQLERELAYATAYGTLNDLEKRYVGTLAQTDRERFIALPAVDRSAELAKREASDPVVYEATDGTKYRASDDPRLVTMAKRSDVAEKAASDNALAAQEADLLKRAEALPHLPGDIKVRTSVLRAIDGIADAEVRKGAHEMLKAQDAALSEAFKARGVRGLGPATSAEQQLQDLAKRKQSENPKLSEAQAYDEVLKTDEGKRLYAQTVAR